MSEARDPFGEGFDAADRLELPEANPYPSGTPEHSLWYDGWCCANDDGGYDADE